TSPPHALSPPFHRASCPQLSPITPKSLHLSRHKLRTKIQLCLVKIVSSAQNLQIARTIPTVLRKGNDVVDLQMACLRASSSIRAHPLTSVTCYFENLSRRRCCDTAGSF